LRKAFAVTLRRCDFAVKNAHCTIILNRRIPMSWVMTQLP
jgi:hypothetical protein